jgi:hypothetical protein
MRVALLFSALLSMFPATTYGQTPPDTKEWGERFNTAGATLSLRKTAQGQLNGHTAVGYNPFASGLPKDVQYVLWIWITGKDPQPAANAYMNNDGKVVNVLADPPNHVTEDPIDLKMFAGKGEVKRVALISADGGLRAFAQVVPFPIEATDGRCRISAVMAEPSYQAVNILVTGLKPKEDLLIDTQFENEKAQNKGTLTEEGVFNSLIFPFVKGKRSGRASFRVTGVSCKVAIAFPWGEGSYQLQ